MATDTTGASVHASSQLGQSNMVGETASPSGTQYPWLFNAPLDLCAFLGSTAIAFGLLALGEPLGLLGDGTPDWLWVATILMIDVAHVYATGFKVYFVPQELRRHPWLYGLTPLLGFATSWILYQQGAMVFWRAIAYLAVFHFVRQQYGWMALYRAKEGDTARIGWWIDTVAIYMATLYPLIYWHTHLPRKFFWFTQGDFIALPSWLSLVAGLVYWIAMSVYLIRVAVRAWRDRRINPGKEIMFLSTVLCWYIGIITFDSDYAFTVTNVITHGVPYLVLVYWVYAVQKKEDPDAATLLGGRWIRYLAILWGLAYLEEFLWDVGVWHDRSWLFGTPQDWSSFQAVLVPLLAVPQITHYVLDGFIWKRKARATSPH